jgi:Protein of unknown function (DUF3303)
MLFIMIERFKGRDAKAVYRRLREQGRGAPDGLRYVDSWVEANFDRCFQLMECDDARLLQQWVAFWGDLVEFEIVPVLPSLETRKTIEPFALRHGAHALSGMIVDRAATHAQLVRQLQGRCQQR